ncbi:MAG TPA: hypothetical protein VF777_13305 [Phycisphaerales bacterium]
MAKLAAAVFHHPTQLTAAIQSLGSASFARDEISVLASESTGRSIAIRTRSKYGDGPIGAGVGGAAAAIAAGMTAVGAVAGGAIDVVGAGPLVGALAGLSKANALSDGLAGGLKGLGVPEHEARVYVDEIKKGGVLVGVRAHGRRWSDAKRIFEACSSARATPEKPFALSRELCDGP